MGDSQWWRYCHCGWTTYDGETCHGRFVVAQSVPLSYGGLPCAKLKVQEEPIPPLPSIVCGIPLDLGGAGGEGECFHCGTCRMRSSQQ